MSRSATCTTAARAVDGSSRSCSRIDVESESGYDQRPASSAPRSACVQPSTIRRAQLRHTGDASRVGAVRQPDEKRREALFPASPHNAATRASAARFPSGSDSLSSRSRSKCGPIRTGNRPTEAGVNGRLWIDDRRDPVLPRLKRLRPQGRESRGRATGARNRGDGPRGSEEPVRRRRRRQHGLLEGARAPLPRGRGSARPSQLPLKLAGRFSTNAATPSRKSALCVAACCSCASISSWSSSVAWSAWSNKRFVMATARVGIAA